MANTYFESQFVLDTASATDRLKATLGAAAGISFPPQLHISGIRWVGATTAGHAAVLTRVGGGVYWESLAGGANNVEKDYFPMVWDSDFLLTTLGSGRLYIYLNTWIRA